MLHGLDLFSGIGGLTVALAPWVLPVAYCENDRYATAVLLDRMANGKIPLAPIWDDVRTLQGDNLPSVDMVYGGFPCQDISVAGAGKGLEGERSGLFFEIMRLADEVRPRFLFLENVPAITARGLGRVLGELSTRGYSARWTMLSAAEVGALHKRKRWWLLAYSQGERLERLRLERGAAKADAEERLPELGGGCWSAEWWQSEPKLGRVAHGVPNRVDRLKCLGNAVVPLQARTAFEMLMGLSDK